MLPKIQKRLDTEETFGTFGAHFHPHLIFPQDLSFPPTLTTYKKVFQLLFLIQTWDHSKHVEEITEKKTTGSQNTSFDPKMEVISYYYCANFRENHTIFLFFFV